MAVRIRHGVAVAALLTLGCWEEVYVPPDGRWNVLVVVPDTVRADHLGINGYPAPTSPALDALAREGANFTQAITAAPRTWQSYTSILTGLYPPRHGVRYIWDHPLETETPTMASVLGARGWETAAFDASNFLRSMTAGKQFQRYNVATRIGGRSEDAVVVERAAKYLGRQRDAPFFAFVRINGAHWPYLHNEWTDEFEPCSGHRHLFNGMTYGLAHPAPGEGFSIANERAFRNAIWTDDIDEDTRRHRIAHYDAEIRATDTLIGQLVDSLRESGLLERTIIVISSDHGESFFEHGYMQHGPRVDDPVMRVPLIVRLPRGHPAHRSGRVVDTLVRTVDIAPTIFDAVGVPAPEGLDGVSLLPAIRGEEPPDLWAYGETGRSFMGIDPERHLPGVEGKQRMIRTAKWKLVWIPDEDGGIHRLYDLHNDPGETVDLAAREPERLMALRRHLDTILAVERQRTPERDLTEEQEQQLRELGYLR